MLDSVSFNQERLGIAALKREHFANAKAKNNESGVTPLQGTNQNGSSGPERFHGAQERGYAFGLLKKQNADTNTAPSNNTSALVSSTPSNSVTAPSGTGGAVDTTRPTPGTNLTSNSNNPQQNTTSFLLNGENAVLLAGGEELNIHVSVISGTDEKGQINKGTVKFEEGGSYVFRQSDHPGSKYVIHGLDDGTDNGGISNPNNIKGHIFLNPGALLHNSQVPPHDDPNHHAEGSEQESPLVAFLAEMARLREQQEEKIAKKAASLLQGYERKDSEGVGAIARPKGKILNIQDDRFDKTTFTNEENTSLFLAKQIAEGRNGQPGNSKTGDSKFGNSEINSKGRKLGHFKNTDNQANEALNLTNKKGYVSAFAKAAPHSVKSLFA